jgi:hypothetical protein
MNLEAGLNELRGNVLRDDAEIASGPDDRLWSDETLVRYIDSAQNRWARRTLALRDASTPQVVEVTLTAGVSTYDLHGSILAVVSARYDTDAYDLRRVGHSLIAASRVADTEWFDPNVAAYPPGRPLAFATDETTSVDTPGGVTLRVWPAPTATEEGKIIHLRVARKPLVPLTLDDIEAEFEIPEEYQLDTLEWAAYLALRNSDVDGHADAASKHENRFNDAVQEVLKDMRRKLFAPMGWQFGQNGFAWDN